MAQLNWTDRAISDLVAIAEFIKHDSEKYAKVHIKRIRKRTGQLKDFPYSGRVVSELNQDEIRELVFGNYRIVYRIVSKDRIDVLTIHHSSRRLTFSP